MKLRPFLCCTALLGAPTWAAEQPAPEPLPLARYSTMAEQSPFALATAVAPVAEPQASFAANWYVAGIARLGDVDFVTIKSRDASQQFSLFGREPQNGVSVASVEWSETIGKSKVILQKGTETAKLEFNEAEIKGPAAGANPVNVAAGKPGVPIMVTPPGSNGAVRSSFQRPSIPGQPPVAGQPPQPGMNVPPPVASQNGGNAAPNPAVTAPVGQPGEIRRRVRVIGAP